MNLLLQYKMLSIIFVSLLYGLWSLCVLQYTLFVSIALGNPNPFLGVILIGGVLLFLFL